MRSNHSYGNRGSRMHDEHDHHRHSAPPHHGEQPAEPAYAQPEVAHPPDHERAMAGSSTHAREHHPGTHEEHAGHDKHAGHSVAMFRDRFWLALLLTIPTVVWSEPIEDL